MTKAKGQIKTKCQSPNDKQSLNDNMRMGMVLSLRPRQRSRSECFRAPMCWAMPMKPVMRPAVEEL
jgi:hypothetical protein